jgi:hypothetical protein
MQKKLLGSVVVSEKNKKKMKKEQQTGTQGVA